MEAFESQENLFFSDLLKEFRRRKKLTQQQLAEQIDASRESVSLWERGQYKPETTTMVHVLAQLLGLDNDEKRLFFEAHLGTASILPLHNLPEHNPYFTGREETLTHLHRQLTVGKPVALIQTQAISGLGGIGKTQVAIEYAYRFREHYHDILWVAADSRETLLLSYLTLARHLRLREREEREQNKVVEAVKRWLREHKGWLLILDNIEDLRLVREFVPTPRQGAVVLTTRRGETRPVAEALALEVLPEEEGSLFLLRRAGYLPREAPLESASAGDREAARAIVQALGGLPLALDQAGAYVAETKRNLLDYLDLFEQQLTALLSRRGTLSPDHPLSVTATFSLAFEQVQQKNEAAIDLLKLYAYLAPDAIPLEIITQGAVHLGAALEPVAVDALQLDHVLETLQTYSLARHDGENRISSIHRLVQAVLQETLDEEERRAWRERAVLAVNAAFPKSEHGTWPQCERLLLHAELCAQYIEQDQVTGEEAGRLLYETASYLQDRARYGEAELLYQRALRVQEQRLGPEHAETAHLLNGLAILYYQQGKYAQAESLYQRTLSIWEQQLGPEHAETARPLNNLAILYYEQGKYREAELLYQRALSIWEQQLGETHPDVARSLNNLAILYYDQGKYREAEPLYQRALSIWERRLGPEHILVAHSLNGLASLYTGQGRYAEAEPLYQRALHIWELRLGLEHPDVAHPLNNLAGLYRDWGKYVEAEPLYLRALHIFEQQLGPEHPRVASTLNGLAELYRDQGKYAEAEPLYQRALHIREQQLGETHPDVARSLTGLASLYTNQGKYAEAEPLYQRALYIYEQQLGPEHALVAHPLNGLAHLYREQGKYAEAEPLYQRALRIREQARGLEHLETAETLHDLAQLQEAQGNREEARACYARSLAIRRPVLGAHNPKTVETRKRLLVLLLAMGQHEEAAQLEALHP